MIDPSVVTDPASAAVGTAASATVVLALLGTLVHKVVDFAKFVSAQDWPSVSSQALSWLGGVAVTFLAGASTIGAQAGMYGVSLGAANGADKILIGLAIGSGASLVKDFIKAKDNTDSAKVPAWFGTPQQIPTQNVMNITAPANAQTVVAQEQPPTVQP